MKLCTECNKEFLPTTKKQIYCGKVCYRRANKAKSLADYHSKKSAVHRIGNCIKCGNTFETNRADRRFCSTGCNAKYNGYKPKPVDNVPKAKFGKVAAADAAFVIALVQKLKRQALYFDLRDLNDIITAFFLLVKHPAYLNNLPVGDQIRYKWETLLAFYKKSTVE